MMRIIPLGMSSVGFLIIAIPILLLGLGGIEITQWYQTRHLVNVALMQAARHASMTHAQPEEIEKSFEQAILPLFSSKESSSRRQQQYFRLLQQRQLPPWRVIVENPNHKHFMDFHRDDLSIAKQTGLLAIDNNYQYEQHQHRGVGLLSQQSIYEANTLTMVITYPYHPLIPGMKSLFKALQTLATDDYAKQLLAHGFLPITHRLSMSMQSHPVEWPSLANGKVIMGTHSSDTPLAHNAMEHKASSHALSTSCTQGIWCKYAPSPQSLSTAGKTLSHPSKTYKLTTEISNSKKVFANHKNTLTPQPTVDTHDSHHVKTNESHPLCGISLCCEG